MKRKKVRKYRIKTMWVINPSFIEKHEREELLPPCFACTRQGNHEWKDKYSKIFLCKIHHDDLESRL